MLIVDTNGYATSVHIEEIGIFFYLGERLVAYKTHNLHTLHVVRDSRLSEDWSYVSILINRAGKPGGGAWTISDEASFLKEVRENWDKSLAEAPKMILGPPLVRREGRSLLLEER